MRSTEVAVVDYGMGNLLSVRRALEHCGARVTVTASPDEILGADRVVLPGVGAFADGMRELRARRLDRIIADTVSLGTPLLGICLGMQLLLSESEEFGTTPGLDLIPGRVVRAPDRTPEGTYVKSPHIGWSSLIVGKCHGTWSGTPLDGLNPGDAVYFVHSYIAMPHRSEDSIADCLYGGGRACAAIVRDNIFGCQFHPEKSGRVGLMVLTNFMTWRSTNGQPA